MDMLIRILEKSVQSNGADFSLTLGHLLNIIKLARKLEIEKSEISERLDAIALEEAMSHFLYGAD